MAHICDRTGSWGGSAVAGLLVAVALSAGAVTTDALSALTNRALNPVTAEPTPLGAPLVLVKDGKPNVVILFDNVHEGKHDLTLYDWNRFMDFTDAHGWRND